MREQGFRNEITSIKKGLHQIVTNPSFGIGQRALLVETDSGNVLWDCVTYLDDETIAAINQLGGVGRMAISHPHFYSAMVEWSEAFGGPPIYLHHLDRKWVSRSSRNVVYWKGEALTLLPGAVLIKLGGHFPGSTVLHVKGRNFSEGALLAGDTVYVVMDRKWVSFMYSFPNLLPLPARKIRDIARRLKPYRFESMFSGWAGMEINGGADAAVQRSAERYVYHLSH